MELATSYWQVADSLEQNGCYKMAWYEKKQMLVAFKGIQTMSLTLSTDDIMPVVNRAWDQSFALKEHVKTAIARRGWNPLKLWFSVAS